MRILIVEDEEKLAQLLKRGLEQEGFGVDYVIDLFPFKLFTEKTLLRILE